MRVFFVLFFVVVFQVSFAQEHKGDNIYVVSLKDKHIVNSSNPLSFLSQRAIDRRERKGIGITESDIPISIDYIQAIKDLNYKIVCRSKWLNTLVVSGLPRSKQILSDLDFVLSVSKVERTKEHSEKIFFKNESEVEKYDIGGTHVKNSNKYDYGDSYTQISALNADSVHNMGYDGKDVIIAVLDAGYRKANSMPVFDSLWDNNQILGTRDFVIPEGDVFSDNIHYHGFSVLSLMGGNIPGEIIGTAPKASYYLFRTEDANSEYLLEEYYWVAAAEYADSLGVDIINSSLGYTQFDNPVDNHTYADMDGNTTPITVGADIAASKGIIVVNSAGNSGTTDWKYIGAPADGDNVFTVGAIDVLGNYADFSSVGPTSDGRVKPDVVALGRGVLVASSNGGTVRGNGTSYSSPLIAGMMACMVQAFPYVSNSVIMDAVRESSSCFNTPDTLLGYGLPDFMKAMNLISAEQEDYSGKKCFALGRNPVMNNLFIFYYKLPEQAYVKIFNFRGALVYSGPLSGSNNVIDISFLRRGMYFISVSGVDFSDIEKFIKI